MSSVADIEEAISRLDEQEFRVLERWFDAWRNQRWDEQMARDVNSGALNFLSAELDDHLAKGEIRPLHEVVRDS